MVDAATGEPGLGHDERLAASPSMLSFGMRTSS